MNQNINKINDTGNNDINDNLKEFLGNEPSSQSLAHIGDVRFEFLVTISCS